MSENSKVYLWDISAHVKALDTPPSTKLPTAPIHTLTGHKKEGFAVCWSPLVTGSLLTGSCDSTIFLTELHNNSSFEQRTSPFVGHKDSVEDLQWSSTEPTVFASCSVDKTIKIWDHRAGTSPAISFVAADTDVNVISWNR
jgi:ribosome assembly protein RRB1